MGFFGDLRMLAQEVRDKQATDKTIEWFRMHKGDDLYWQQLLEIISQAQHWALQKNACLMAGKEKGFDMAAKNEQGYLECLDRVEREVGVDKEELERRINKALGRDGGKEGQMPLKDTMHIEEAAELLVLLCASEWADEDSPEPWAVRPLRRELETTELVERTFLIEATFLAYFAVDYATAVVLGQHNPTRGALLDAVHGKLIFCLPKESPDLCFVLSDALNDRLTMYSIAYHFRTKDMPDRVCMIAGTFSKLVNEGRSIDPDLTVKAGVHFVEIVDRVNKFLSSVNLVT
ncbi:MAG: hypothetical protein JW955_07070 [Sedimentisphaerales bacterium]|nr:hypothetical protein [Sedimentisphaerales bacterium]